MRTATRLGYNLSKSVYASESKDIFASRAEIRLTACITLVEGVVLVLVPTNKYHENCRKVEKLGVCNW